MITKNPPAGFLRRRSVHTFFGALLVAAFLCASAGHAQAERDWNVLLLTFDTTRADFIGCYGRTTASTPNLDGLAAEGAMFEQAFASNPVTEPAHSTIMTGVYPLVHGVRDNTFFKLPADRPTLATILGKAGWATGAAIGGFPLVKAFGLNQGFDFYEDDIVGNREDFRGRPVQRHGGSWYDERPAGQVNDAILPWLREHIDERFFVWLHYWDPHLPHIAPAPYGELYANDPYQGEIAYADRSLGTILQELKRAGVYDRTIIVMLADHGEGRLEHNEATHAFLAYSPTLHVPFILRAPKLKGGRKVSQRVGSVDVVPTILDLLGVKGPDDLQGRSLVSLINDPKLDDEAPPLYYSESMSPRLSHGFGELRVLYDGSLKYIFGPRPELFNLDDDPAELHDLVDKQPEDALRMKGELAEFIKTHASSAAGGAAHEVDDETRARLEALGYLDSAGDDESKVVEETLRSDGVAPQDRVNDINLASRLRQEIGAGQFAEAKRTAERLVETAPSNVFYRAALARALVGLGKLDEAAKVVEGTDKLGGSNQDGFLGVAQAIFDADQHKRGRDLAARVIKADDTAAARVVAGRMALKDDDAEDFKVQIAKAIELDPEYAPARLEMAKYLLGEKELDEAEVHLRMALGSAPLDINAHLAWARLLRARGDVKGSLARVDRALRFAPTSCDARVQKLELLIELNEKTQIRRLRRELERDCRDEKTRAKLSALGDKHETK